MRELVFLFPEMAMQQGGHSAQMAFLRLAKKVCTASAATYQIPVAGTPHLDTLLEKAKVCPDRYIFIIHWGPDIASLSTKLKGYAVVYVAHSTGWGFSLPLGVPILAVSRNSQAYWGKHAPRNPIYYLPNIIADTFHNNHQQRSTDVLVMQRKNSRYVTQQLVPSLQTHCRVRVIEGWVDDLAAEMRNSKIFIYDSSEYWKQQGLSEGFGLPPLEAMACGCTVFSSLNDALSDYLDPGINCLQLGVHSLEFDTSNILTAVSRWLASTEHDSSIKQWRADSVSNRLEMILPKINSFFDNKNNDSREKISVPIKSLTNIYICRLKRLLRKIISFTIQCFDSNNRLI